jgi:hypothetical protein
MTRGNAFDNEGIVTINPRFPPILGDLLIWGAPPDPRQEISCTSFSAVSIYLHEIIRNCPEGQGLLLLFNTEVPYGKHKV